MALFGLRRDVCPTKLRNHRQSFELNEENFCPSHGFPNTKFVILGFTQALQGGLISYYIRVVDLFTSFTDTDMIKKLEWFDWIKLVFLYEVTQAFSGFISTVILLANSKEVASWLSMCLGYRKSVNSNLLNYSNNEN